MPKLTKSDWTARAHAYEEAADHLDQSWTDDKKEMTQGKIVGSVLRAWADKCRENASFASDAT